MPLLCLRVCGGRAGACKLVRGALSAIPFEHRCAAAGLQELTSTHAIFEATSVQARTAAHRERLDAIERRQVVVARGELRQARHRAQRRQAAQPVAVQRQVGQRGVGGEAVPRGVQGREAVAAEVGGAQGRGGGLGDVEELGELVVCMRSGVIGGAG